MIDIIVLVAGLASLAASIWGALGTRSVEERYLDICRRRLSEMERNKQGGLTAASQPFRALW